MKTKNWDELTFADNFMFCMILEHNPELCRKLIELLLHIKIEKLEVPQAEKNMQQDFDSKSVRFDVYTKDEKRIFDLEMQLTDKKNLPKRSRYYQSIIDVDNLSKGENYTKLKDTYIVFICMKDIFKKKLPVYFFENICRQDKNLKLNDRTFKVFFNATCCDKLKSDEERDFFNFLKGHNAQSDLAKSIQEKVEKAKKNKAWRKQYMTWQQTLDEEKELAREEGLAEGRAEGLSAGARQKAVETAKKMLTLEKLSVSEIAQCTGLTKEEVLSLKNE